MRIYNRLISKPFPSAEELMALDDELIGGWLYSLPPYFRDDDFLVLNPDYALGHSISKWRFRNTRIIMYRPFLIRWALQPNQPHQDTFSGAEHLATNRCLNAAKESINSIRLFWQSHNHTRLAAWYVL
jgi:mannosyl-oligosaccharide alpha-1,2-mannosidase